ncbi:MAG: HD domain-containing protein [Actinocatenispora sp.]
MTDADAAGAMSFIFEAGVLKRARRTGWWFAGNRDPESIAEHSFRVGIVGTVLAAMEGADPARVALLGLLHDTQETRVTDIPHSARRYVTAASNESVTADQVAGAPQPVRDVIQAAVHEYEAGETAEALVARDADKLECLVQAVEYREAGYLNVQPFIDSALASLTTASARRLAEQAVRGDTMMWQRTFRA